MDRGPWLRQLTSRLRAAEPLEAVLDSLSEADDQPPPGERDQLMEALRDCGAAAVPETALVLLLGYCVRCHGDPLLHWLQLFAEGGGSLASALTDAEVAALLQLELACHGHASDLSALDGCPRSWVWVRWLRPRGCCVVSRGHTMRVQRLRPEPRMALVEGFLSEVECRHVIERARAWLHPSRVVNHAAQGEKAQVSAARSSSSCKVSPKDDVVIRRAVQRAAFLAGLSPQHSEAVQVVHYKPAQEYRPHFDWFSGDDARLEERLALRGNRLLSFFVYLQLPEAGGKTGFPTLRESFQPAAGGALVWYNLDRHGVPDEKTLHAGEPVERGEKWGMNIWLRERAVPRRVWPRVTLALHALPGGATRATLTVAAPSSKSQEADGAASTETCDVCGGGTSPMGLCLCRSHYGG